VSTPPPSPSPPTSPSTSPSPSPNVEASASARQGAQHNPYSRLAPGAEHGAGNGVLAGLSAALQGFPGAITPIILAVSSFGAVAVPWAWWGILVTSSLGILLAAWLGGSKQLVAGNRSASTVVFLTLVAQTSPRGVDGEISLLVLFGAQLALVLAGIWLLIGAQLKAGQLLRMIPYPVIAGVSNATALIVLWLALKAVMSSWLSAGVTAAAMLLASFAWTRLQKQARWLALIPAVLPAIAVGLLVLIYVFPSTLPQLGGGLVTQAFAKWPGMQSDSVAYTLLHYGSVIVPGSFALALLLALESFVAAARLEAEFAADMDYDRELHALGAGNAFCGFFGGLPMSRSVVRSLAVANANAEGWSAHLVCAAVTVGALLLLGGALLDLPKGLIAGMLVLEALLILDPWTKKLLSNIGQFDVSHQGLADPRLQALLLLSFITAIGVFGNLLWATVAGLALSIMFVLVRLSRNLAAHWEYADTFRSRRMRTVSEDVVIRHRHERIGVLLLKGSLFFGNSFRISALADELSRETQIAVIDFAQVGDIDASGGQALRILTQRLRRRGRDVIYSSLTRDMAEQILALGIELPVQGNVFADLDHALESAENRVLMDATMKLQPVVQQSLNSNLLVRGLLQNELYELLKLCVTKTFKPHDLLFAEGAQGEGVMMIEVGLVTVMAADEPGAPRVATFSPGQFLGEISFVEGSTYSRSARADAPTRVAVLSREALASFAQAYPQAAIMVVNNISRELASRLRATTGVMEAMSGNSRQGRWVRTSA
jgi:sulfate permease, SulP family